jgi:MFS family permease
LSAGRTGRAWTVPLLVAASACSFIDRQILSLLVEPIKADLQLTDTGVSLLLGLAFVAIYAIAGPPLGWLIDRTRRWRVVGAGVLAWSLFTAGGAMAGSYAQLFLMRMGVGIGEATLNPAAYSLISDTVPPAKRGLAISLFGLGVYVGAGLALVIGGQVIGLLTAHGAFHLPLLGVVRPWQASFLVVGALGLPVALAAFLMPEPTRRNSADTPPPLAEVLQFLARRWRVLGGLAVAWATVFMAGYSVGAWFAAFMSRTYGWPPVSVGLAFGGIVVIFGSGGAILGGLLSDRFGNRTSAGRLQVVAAMTAFSIPFAAAFPLFASPAVALACAGLFTFGQAGAASAIPAVLQDILPSHMRGLASALLLALFTDRFFGDPAALRYSLAITIPAMLAVSALAAISISRAYVRLRKEVPDEV